MFVWAIQHTFLIFCFPWADLCTILGVYLFLDLPTGTKWFRYKVSIHHLLGSTSIWHTLEGAGWWRLPVGRRPLLRPTPTTKNTHWVYHTSGQWQVKMKRVSWPNGASMPKGSFCGIFTPIYHGFKPNVGRYYHTRSIWDVWTRSMLGPKLKFMLERKEVLIAKTRLTESYLAGKQQKNSGSNLKMVRG